jgi:hypothetical protein
MMTSKPPIHGVISTWLIHDVDGKAYKLYQAGPQLYAPIDLVRFTHQVATCVNEVRERYEKKDWEFALARQITQLGDAELSNRLHPVVHKQHAGQLGLLLGQLGPISREMYLRMSELYISLDNFVNRRRPQPTKVAYVWEVWCVERGDVPRHMPHPGCEIAFTANDKDGVPDVNFTFERATPKELVELLEARDLMKKTFKL